MRRTTFTFIAVSLLMAASGASFAASQQQDQPSPPATQAAPPHEKTNLRERLALTAEQFAQVKAINQDRKTQINAAQSDPTLSPAARHRKVKDIQMNAETRIRAMLTENQLAEYDQIKRERREEAIRRRQTAQPPQ